jgi:hypothetical protein
MADSLSLQEKLMQIEILKKRISEPGRKNIIRDVKEADAEFDPRVFLFRNYRYPY